MKKRIQDLEEQLESAKQGSSAERQIEWASLDPSHHQQRDSSDAGVPHHSTADAALHDPLPGLFDGELESMYCFGPEPRPCGN